MDIGTTIKKCRQLKKLTQKKLAKKIGISVSYLSLLEQGKRELNMTLLESIAKSLKISVSILVFMSAEKNDIPELGDELSTKLSKLIFELVTNDK